MEKSNIQGGSVSRESHHFVVPYIKIDITHSWCPRCRKWLLFDDFYINRSRPGGLSSECKLCNKQYKKENLNT